MTTGREQGADGVPADAGRGVHNEVRSSVDGPVVQVGRDVRGDIVVNPPRTPLQDALAEAAEQLAQAVGTRLRREEEQQQVQDPFPLPVRWQLAPEELTDHWANIRRAPAGAASSPMPLTGRLDGIVEVYRQVPSGRLVVLGRAGSGKTILTLRFVLDSLKVCAATDPVPVIFSLGSWNPADTSLRDWLIGRLERDYPGLTARGPGRSTLAAALVEAGRILPVLDGFDEIADGLHRAALEALNIATLPLVLTSRPAEYAAAVAGTDVLTSAAGVELLDLSLTDLVDYLPRTARKITGATTVWEPVLTQLREHPHTLASVNLAAVLRTPLMVALARAIYSDTPDQDPSALLNTDRFSTPEALEDHLLDEFIPTAYRHQPDHRLAADRPRRPRHWDPDRVQDWLGHLARHLNRLGTPELAWWQLGNSMHRLSRVLVVGGVVGLAVGLAAMLTALPMSLFDRVFQLVDVAGGGLGGAEFVGVLPFMLLNGLVFGAGGLVFGLVLGGSTAEPSRLQIQIRGRTRGVPNKRLMSWVVTGSIGGLVGGFLAGLVKLFANLPPIALLSGLTFGLAKALVPGPVNGIAVGIANGLVLGSAGGLVFGLVGGIVGRFETPIDIRSALSPPDLLRTNRKTTVFQSLVFGLVIGLAAGSAGVIEGVIAGGPLQTLLAGLEVGLLFGFAFGPVFGLGYGLGATAWGRWVILSRIWLPLTGRLPWRVMAFLQDAHRRGVLRQSGAVYQFRHSRLQDHLDG